MAGGSLLAALKQYVGDALPGGSLTPELAPVRQYAAGVKQRAGQLVADPAGFARSAALDVLPNEAEANAARAKLMGGSLDPQAYQSYMGKLQDMGNFLGSIRVYHGSPHKFDKFDLSKMGTGEGAQAYGHGGYVAEAPDVAQNYIPRDAKFENNVMRMYKQAERAGDYDAMAVYERYLLHDTPSAVEQYVKEAASGGGDARKLQQANEAAQRLWERQQAGYLYEANLRWPDAAREAADPMGPQHFLDWDKPLSEQPESIQTALKKFGLVDFDKNIGPSSTGEIKPLGWTKNVKSMIGREFYDKLTKGKMSDQVFTSGAPWTNSQAIASSELSKIGIPGIRYLDAGSRGTGQGTSNYVVFDDALIELLKRNGVPIGK